MIPLLYQISIAILSFSFFAGLFRLIQGKGLLNRLLAFDLIALCIISFTVFFSLENQTTDFIEIILIFSLLGFITTIAFMDMLFRGLSKND